MLDMCQNGSSKAEILAAIINSSEYLIMNGYFKVCFLFNFKFLKISFNFSDIFKLRIYTNGEGHKERYKTFESVAKKKLSIGGD